MCGATLCDNTFVAFWRTHVFPCRSLDRLPAQVTSLREVSDITAAGSSKLAVFSCGIVRLLCSPTKVLRFESQAATERLSMGHTNNIEYGRKLINAGVTGLRNGHTEFDPEKAHALVTRSAAESAQLALAGACLGVVPGCLLARRSRSANALLFGVVGSVLGFAAAFSWKTRSLSSSLAHSAMKEVHRAKDEHWLERNPIDYA